MKRVEVVTKTSAEINIEGKPVSELLSNIAKLCHRGLADSSSKQEGCDMKIVNMMITEMTWNIEYHY